MLKAIKFIKSQGKIYIYIYIDIKIFAKSENNLGNLIQTIKIYCQDIRMDSVIEMCAMLIMKKGKRKTTEGKERRNPERIRTLRKKITSTWEYWKWTPTNKQRRKKV